MTLSAAVSETTLSGFEMLPRLWVYTNYDCNLQCSYCVAESSPRAERRGLSSALFRQVVDEAATLNLERLFLTGGEPFLIPEIFEMLEYAAERLPTTVLTNAMLFQGRRLRQLRALAPRNLAMQVSLDSADADTHDAYRGRGAWEKSIQGIRLLLDLGFPVFIGSTETPLSSPRIDELRAFVASLGIPPERHYVRPLAKRGFSQEGIELLVTDLVPELTVNVDGVFWHPFGTDKDLLLSKDIFPLADAFALLAARFQGMLESGSMPERFHCAVE